MLEKYRNHLVLTLSVVFLVVNIFLVIEEFYWALLLPLGIVLLILYFVSLDKILFLITLLTPLSIGLSISNGSFGLSVPVEPMLIGVSVLFVFRLVFYFNYDLRLLKHPLSILIVLYLFWMFITSINSKIPVVSITLY